MTAPPRPDRLLHDWDADRPRSQQRRLGMSDVGCRRKAGYILNGVEPTDDGFSMEAALGTAIHLPLADAARKLAGDRDLIEAEVEFAGILGHVDWVWVDPTGVAWVIDWKSVSFRRYEAAEEDGPSLGQLYQTVLYAAAAAAMGYKVRWIVLDYIGRDSGKLIRHVRPFRLEEVRAALEWYAMIRDSDLEMLPRDYRPGSPFCDRCPFRTECWGSYARPKRSQLSALYVTDPNAPRWRDQLAEGRKMAAAGKAMADEARGALDAIRPNDKGRSPDCVVDEDGKALRWTVSEDVRPDLDTIRADYARAGAEMPEVRKEKVTLSIVARPKEAP